MRRGTTPTIKATVVGLQDVEIDEIYLTVKQLGVEIEKSGSDIVVDGDEISVTLTQQETLSLAGGSSAAIQVRVLSKNGTAYASNIVTVPVGEILKDGVIGDG